MEIFGYVLEMLFPRRCVGCAVTTGNTAVLCDACLRAIYIQRSLFCGRCFARLPQDVKVCHKDCPYVLGVAASYQNKIVERLVKGLKFRFAQPAAKHLASLLIAYCQQVRLSPTPNTLVVPVPLSAKRLRARGYNQAQLIADAFASHFNLPVSTEVLRRSRDTAPQSAVHSFKERQKNVVDCFQVVDEAAVKGKTVFLIDDVTTSGSTFMEAARVLKRSGAKVIALAAATAAV